MNKKIKIVIAVFVILILGAGGFFGWRWEWQKNQNKIVSEAIESSKFERLENYIIKETPEGKIIDNKNVGLVFKVPNEWNVEKTDSIMGGGGIADYGITLFTSDLKPNPNSPWVLVPEKGCLINVYIMQDEYSGELLKNLEKEEIQDEALEIEGGSRVKGMLIGGHPALRTITGDYRKLEENPDAFLFVGIEIPFSNNKKCFFETYIPSQDKQRCIQEFNKFLETVSVD